jgi:hypothetical protein
MTLQRNINSHQISGPRTITVDTAFTLAPIDFSVKISSVVNSVKVITPPAVTEVSIPSFIDISMTARTAGSYTVACQEGTVTFDAAGESALFMTDPTHATAPLHLVALRGATVA